MAGPLREPDGDFRIRYWVDRDGKLLRARWQHGEGTCDVLYENR